MVSTSLHKKLVGFTAIVTLVSVLAGVLLLHPPRFVTELENRTWDWRLSAITNPRAANRAIKLILVDQASLDFFEKEYSLTWPIPRDAYKYVIEFLKRGGAKGIAFDILFTESSAQAVEGDRDFAAATGGSLPVVSSVSLEQYDKYLKPEKRELFEKRQLEIENTAPFRDQYLSASRAPKFKSATLPIPELLEQSHAFGDVQAAPDSDGVFRHHVPGALMQNIPVLSLPFAFYHLVNGDKKPFPVSEYVDAKGRLAVVPHGGSGTYEAYSLAAIMQAQASLQEGKAPAIAPEIFRDAWVILGTSAPGLLDLRPTPLEPRGNGVEFVAAVLDNILGAGFARTPGAASMILLTFALVAAITGCSLFLSSVNAQRIFAFCIFGLFVFGAVAAAKLGFWIPFVTPALAMLATLIFGLSFQYQLEGKEREYLRNAFQFYVSPAVVQKIVSNPGHLSLVGERRKLSIFFSDIAGFTTISETLEPESLVLLLNEYLTLLADIIQNSGGTVDKYVGDAVVAFWNAPLGVNDHELRAVQTAIACQQQLALEHGHFLEAYGVSLKTRIGVNTGDVSVGNFGSRSRFNYTIIGDAANLASRLEGANKVFGTQILISEAVYSGLADQIPCRRVADIRVVGKTEPVRVYEPQTDDSQSVFQPEQSAIFESALRAFDIGNLDSAAAIFSQLPGDSVAKAYLKEITQRINEGFDPNAWSTVWNLSEK